MADDRIRPGLDVAIIGMSCRFPGANDLEQFWQNLVNGVESITRLTDADLESSEEPWEHWTKPNYIRAKGIIDDVEYFDASFFGYNAREADLMDPQIRVLHECSWHALEQAGYVAGNFPGSIGMYTGSTNNFYWEVKSYAFGGGRDVGMESLSDKDHASTRVSYKLNLTGPSFIIETQCSTSLVALHLACQGLLAGDCDMALAGGVSISLPYKRGYFYNEGSLFSSDGYCRTFDEKASGTVFSDGAGVVLLKRAEDAIAAGDNIFAIIKGTATNNDGNRKVGYIAPSVEGQADVIKAALSVSEIDPETISYVEAHGTATNLGDPIEIEGLKKAFATDKRQYCKIGSVKTNIGHTNNASGVAGLMKIVLSLIRKQIPPTLHFDSPNPKIDFEESPFIVAKDLSDWPANGNPRRAGLSSFGVGGTNAHVIVEEGPEQRDSSDSRAWQMVLTSARTETALEKTSQNIAAFLQDNPSTKLADIAYTLQVGRQPFKYRQAVVCRDATEAISTMTEGGGAQLETGIVSDEVVNTVFMFPGQGAQYVDMAKEIYEGEVVFRDALDECLGIVKQVADFDLAEIIFPGGDKDCATESLKKTHITQPALFSIEYALAKLLITWGTKPDAMIGHSIGEYVAACLADVLSLEDALRLVCLRGRLMFSCESGSMLSVALAEEELVPLLDSEVSLATVNSDRLTVVSGPHSAIDNFAQKLDKQKIRYARLHTSHAFHSEMMDPILEEFEAAFESVELQAPRLPFVSNLTGEWITDEQATSARYWCDQLRQTVRFGDGLKQLFGDEKTVFLEVGPGNALSTFVRQHGARPADDVAVNLLKHPREKGSDSRYLLNSIARLWLSGLQIDWSAFYAAETRNRVALPTYPFERARYWIDGNPYDILTGKPTEAAVTGQPEQVLYHRIEWGENGLKQDVEKADAAHWLVFGDENGVGMAMQSRLEESGHRVTMKLSLSDSESASNGIGAIASDDDAYKQIISDFLKDGDEPKRILHLWSLNGGSDANGNWSAMEGTLNHGFYSLVNIVKALGRSSFTETVPFVVVSEGIHSVTGDERLFPMRATLFGATRGIPLEYPNVKMSLLDCECCVDGSPSSELVSALVDDANAAEPIDVAAYRDGKRYTPAFVAVSPKDSQKKQPSFKENGVYLITGGLGGVGLEIARLLGEKYHANLILTGRSEFPAHEEWDAYLLESKGSESTRNTIAILKQLEEKGAEVQVFSADVTDEPAMRQVVEKARTRFGKVDGVVHSAGVPGGELIQALTREHTEKVMAPKIKGTITLDKIFEKDELDFFVMCSSYYALVGGMGQASYSAANCFMDLFACEMRNAGKSGALSINWDAWREVGMAVKSAKEIDSKTGDATPKLKPFSHPLFEGFEETDHGRIYHSKLSVTEHWPLKDHKIMNVGTLPGTAHLEMVRAAAVDLSGADTVELRNVYFLTPITVDDETPRPIKTILSRKDDKFDFSLQSYSEDDRSWREHCKGGVATVADAEPPKGDLSAIAKVCNASEALEDSLRISDLTSDFIQLSGRWSVLKNIKYGKDEALARLELPVEFANDLEDYPLHPAILDVANGFFLLTIDNDADGHLPFFYKRLRINAPLTQVTYSHVRHTKDGAQPGMPTFDVSIYNEEGESLVEVEGYVAKTIVGATGDAEAKSDVAENTRLIISKAGNLDSLSFVQTERHQPIGDEVQIEVFATGLNFKEVLIALGMIPVIDPAQFDFGVECAGRVVACGPDVTNLKVGDDVIAIGASCFGRFVTLSSRFVAPKPRNFSMVEAATLPIAYLTAYYALVKMARLAEGERVLIHAASGGVGLAAVQIATWVGAEIFATAGSPRKRDYLQSLGIKYVMDSRSLSFADDVMKYTNGEGVDVLLNSLAGEFITKGLAILNTGGRFLEIGVRDIYEDSKLGMRPFEKGLSFIAINEIKKLANVSVMLREITEFIEKGALTYIPHEIYKLDQTADAFKTMAQTKHIGKLVVAHKPEATLHLDQEHHPEPDGGLTEGLLSRQGVQAFQAILQGELSDNGEPPAQIAVAARDFFTDEKSTDTNIASVLKGFKNRASGQSVRPRPELSTEYVAPTSDLEMKIAKVWQNYLRIEKVGVCDVFFELGASSLDIVQVNSELKDEHNIDIPVAVMFENPTIEAVLTVLNEQSGESAEAELAENVEGRRSGRQILHRRLEKQKTDKS